MFAIPAARLPASIEGTDFGQRITFFEPSQKPTNGNAPNSSTVAVPVSPTVAVDKAASATLSPVISVHHDSAEHPTASGPQEPSAVQPRVSPRPTVTKPRFRPRLRLCCLHIHRRLCRPFPVGLISSRARHLPLLASPRSQFGSPRSYPSPPTVPRPPPTASKPRPPLTTSPSEVSPRPVIDPVSTVPIQPAIYAAKPAPPLLGALLPDVPQCASTPAALPEMPPTAEIEFI